MGPHGDGSDCSASCATAQNKRSKFVCSTFASPLWPTCPSFNQSSVDLYLLQAPETRRGHASDKNVSLPDLELIS